MKIPKLLVLSACLLAVPLYAQRGGAARGGFGGGFRGSPGFGGGFRGPAPMGGFRGPMGGAVGGGFRGPIAPPAGAGFRGPMGGPAGGYRGGFRGPGFAGRPYFGGYRGGFYGGFRGRPFYRGGYYPSIFFFGVGGFWGYPFYSWPYYGWPYYGAIYGYPSYYPYAYPYPYNPYCNPGLYYCGPGYYGPGYYDPNYVYGGSADPPDPPSDSNQPYGDRNGPSPAPVNSYAAPRYARPQSLADRPPPAQPLASQPDYYLIAFKDRHIETAVTYSVDGDAIRWTTSDHQQREALLSDVDVDYSRELNLQRRVDFHVQ
jgi:hypothetical protein